jgi:excisionase family DNA binding protein
LVAGPVVPFIGWLTGPLGRVGRSTSVPDVGYGTRPIAFPADPQRPIDEPEVDMQPHDDDALLTPSEVAAMFRVNPKTVTRWARAGKISAIRTLGGHRRFRASEIRQFLEQVEDSERI